MKNRDLIINKIDLTEDKDLIERYFLDIEEKLGNCFRRFVTLTEKQEIEYFLGMHPKSYSTKPLTERQWVTSQNCLNALHSDRLGDAWREFYDCIHNYNDDTHEVTCNEYVVYMLLINTFKNLYQGGSK